MVKPKIFKAFTIAEVTVVLAIMAILASIIGVVYVGVTARVRDNAVISDANTVMAAEKAYTFKKNAVGKFWYSPNGTDSDLNVSLGTGNVANVVVNANGYCIRVYNPDSSTYKDMASAYKLESVAGICAVLPASTTPPLYMQSITSANCPTTLTRAVDARDNHTYWVQKLADGKCWMLTNLAYAGGGTNTYNDVKSLTNGTGGAATYTVASYYVVPSTVNYTTEPTDPSTSTDGTGQYGYLYNFCGANGGQTGNGACSDTVSTAVNTAVSVCPSGWRLPVGNGGEFSALNTAVNGGLTNTDDGLRTSWLGQRSGNWNSGFGNQGSVGYYWSSNQYSAALAYNLGFVSANVNPAGYNNKSYGNAVRCVAS